MIEYEKRSFFFRGYNIGVRLIDDFLARNPNVSRCQDLRETAEILSKVKILLYFAEIEKNDRGVFFGTLARFQDVSGHYTNR